MSNINSYFDDKLTRNDKVYNLSPTKRDEIINENSISITNYFSYPPSENRKNGFYK